MQKFANTYQKSNVYMYYLTKKCVNQFIWYMHIANTCVGFFYKILEINSIHFLYFLVSFQISFYCLHTVTFSSTFFGLPLWYNTWRIIPRWSMLRKSVALEDAQLRNFFQVSSRLWITWEISCCLYYKIGKIWRKKPQ